MIIKLISLFVSFVMSFTGIGSAAAAGSIKCVFQNAYSLVAERSDLAEKNAALRSIDGAALSLAQPITADTCLVLEEAV